MTQQSDSRPVELVRLELLGLAREWNVRPLTPVEEKSYTTVLTAHHLVDVQAAFRSLREAGQGRSHTMMPMLFAIVSCVRRCYNDRTAKAQQHTPHSEAA